jgi:hypothetical protein
MNTIIHEGRHIKVFPSMRDGGFSVRINNMTPTAYGYRHNGDNVRTEDEALTMGKDAVNLLLTNLKKKSA